jgi:CubicO group peptidase (beta-lactamase class C family)
MTTVDKTSRVDTSANSAVQQLLERQVTDGRQLGVQVAVYQGGKQVVDAWAGAMGPEDSRPVQPDSLFLSFSCTKGPTALAFHILAERGQIDYEAPVAKYWPEFGQHGKDKLTIAQALSHQGGLHAMPAGPFKVEYVTDWDAMVKYIANGVPAYEPGTETGYHAATHAWLTGGIVQGATGRHIKEVIHSEIAKPLGVDDSFFVGIPDGIEERLTNLEIWNTDPAVMGLPADSDFYKAMPADMWQHFNKMEIRKACMPSGNGHFSARSLAKMYGALANGGEIEGVRLVPEARIAHMNRMVTDRVDRVLGTAGRKGIGFMLGGEMNGVAGAMGRRETAFGHPGAGGAIGFADPEVGLGIAVTTNKMAFALPGQGTTEEICNLVRKELGAD